MCLYTKTSVKREIRERWNPPKWRGDRISTLFRDTTANTKRNRYGNWSDDLRKAQNRDTGGRWMLGLTISRTELLDPISNMHVKNLNWKVHFLKISTTAYGSGSSCIGRRLVQYPLGLPLLFPHISMPHCCPWILITYPLIESFISLISYSQAALPGATGGNPMRFVKCQFD